MIAREKCDHKELWFGSGDFYIFCQNCGARWATISWQQPEYGYDKDGKPIGVCPEDANKGEGSRLSGTKRIKEP